MGLKAQILQNFADRLRTITAANGYGTNVVKVFADEIPMGLDLEEFNLPAILCIDGQDKQTLIHQCVEGLWNIELQLIHKDLPDSVMNEFVKDVFKCVWANSATAERNDGFRSIHPNIYEITPLSISPDLNMIEANRIYGVSLQIHYRTRLYNL